MRERTKQSAMSALPQGSHEVPNSKPESTGPKDVLLELYNLLEAYAPPWYTQAHHGRAESALRLPKQS